MSKSKNKPSTESTNKNKPDSQSKSPQTKVEELNVKLEALIKEKTEAVEELAKVEAQISIDPERFVDYKRISARISEIDVEIVKIGGEIKLELAVEAAKTEASESEDEVEAYEVPEGEEHLYHAILEVGVKFDPNTGKRISKPYIQKFTYKEFKQFEKNAAVLGYAYKVLHQPE